MQQYAAQPKERRIRPEILGKISPLADKLPVNELVQDFAIYERKRHVLYNKIPCAITAQDLIKEHKLENIEIETPTNYDDANKLKS